MKLHRSILVQSFAILVLLCAIIIPFAMFGDDLEVWVDRLLEPQYSGWTSGIIILLLASDIVLPLPSSLIATAAGALLGWLAGTVTAFIGLTLGHLIGYAMGRFLGKPATEYLHGEQAISGAEYIQSTPGLVAIIASRPVPVLAEAVTIVSGAAEVPFGRFLLVVSSANLGLAAAYAWFGQMGWETGSILLVFVASISVPLVGMAIWRVLNKNMNVTS